MTEAAKRRRVRLTILVKILVATTVPTSLLFALFAVTAHHFMRRDLEAELGTRLAMVAASAATQIRGGLLSELGPGDEDHLLYASTRRKLQEIARATGVARIAIFDREFGSRADSVEELPIGSELYQAELDRQELGRLFARGELVSGVLFEGHDGRQYKTGYAPIYRGDEREEVVLAVAVDAPATFFDRLADLRHSLVLYGIASVLAMVLVSVLVATLLTRPIRQLAGAAERIGKGELSAPIPRTSRDEVGRLAETMDEMRRDLQARDQRMQQMLSGIAHEVRNPLGGIQLFTGILRDELDSGDERRAHVDRIDREVGYLGRVVEEFLAYARRPEVELDEVRIGAVVEELCQLEQGEAERAGVTLACEIDHQVVVRGDEGQLRRAILNLLRNAVQAAANIDDGAVTVTVTGQPGAARISVHNTGPVIADEVKDRIFEPFFTTREKGTGLGLAFVAQIVGEHRGTIEVTSDDEHGTAFVMHLPAV